MRSINLTVIPMRRKTPHHVARLECYLYDARAVDEDVSNNSFHAATAICCNVARETRAMWVAGGFVGGMVMMINEHKVTGVFAPVD